MPAAVAAALLSVALFAGFFGIGRADGGGDTAGAGKPASRLPADLQPALVKPLGEAAPLPRVIRPRARASQGAAPASAAAGQAATPAPVTTTPAPVPEPVSAPAPIPVPVPVPQPTPAPRAPAPQNFDDSG